MAVSKKKSASKKKAGKRATPPKTKKKSSSKKPPSEAIPDRSIVELEQALTDAQSQIGLLIEDREMQMAIAEGADAERSMLQDELEEAQKRIRNLQQKLDERAPSPPVASPEAEELDYEEEEEEPEGDTEDLDDVEAVYTRMDDPRVRRQELDHERLDRESEVGDEPYWLVCPKCGGSLEEADAGEVKLERCENCGGLYLDQGEVEMLLTVARGTEGLHRIRGILQF